MSAKRSTSSLTKFTPFSAGNWKETIQSTLWFSLTLNFKSKVLQNGKVWLKRWKRSSKSKTTVFKKRSLTWRKKFLTSNRHVMRSRPPSMKWNRWLCNRLNDQRLVTLIRKHEYEYKERRKATWQYLSYYI